MDDTFELFFTRELCDRFLEKMNKDKDNLQKRLHIIVPKSFMKNAFPFKREEYKTPNTIWTIAGKTTLIPIPDIEYQDYIEENDPELYNFYRNFIADKLILELEKENESLKALLYDCQFCVDSEGLKKEISDAIADYEQNIKKERCIFISNKDLS